MVRAISVTRNPAQSRAACRINANSSDEKLRPQ
jgi:hypothetical protein